MMVDLRYYKTIIFDCDGVVLNSNSIKTHAFYLAAVPYGTSAADQLVAHHIANGGISRYSKFSTFLTKIVPHKSGPGMAELLATYEAHVREQLHTCEIEPSLYELRNDTVSSRWMLVSGSSQRELVEIFFQRGLDKLFDGGIFGSPCTKDEIFSRERINGNLLDNGIYLGDSKYDHQAASLAGLDFIFVSQWTEFADWAKYCDDNCIEKVRCLAELIQA